MQRTGSEFFEAAAVNFISQVHNRIIWVEADCKSEQFLNLVAPKLVRLKKITICDKRKNSIFTNSNLLLHLIMKKATTLEELNICKATMDQHLDVNLPNLKILNLECVSGEISLLSLLTSITNNSPNLGTVTLWKIYLQNRYYYLHNLPVYTKQSLQIILDL